VRALLDEPRPLPTGRAGELAVDLAGPLRGPRGRGFEAQAGAGDVNNDGYCDVIMGAYGAVYFSVLSLRVARDAALSPAA
jgi:hypothetical protein